MHLQEIFSENLRQSLMITSFVMVMMLIIEFVNVYTKGRFSYSFKKNAVLQVFMAALLGIIPGCLGTYAVVSLFTHNVIGLGGLVAAMIATSGDETFLMFSMFPGTALKIMIMLYIVAVITGLIINFFQKKRSIAETSVIGFSVHKDELKKECLSISWNSITNNFRFITFRRAVLLVALIFFISGILLGEFAHFHGHTELSGSHAGHEPHGGSSWVSITFLILSVIALFITFFATNHFLEHHLWDHILKVHFLRIFLWTFGTLVIINVLTHFIDIQQLISSNKYAVLILAILIGIIPVSGPHIIFVTLFFNGSIPLSILFANSVVQDGHGSLPLFAESKRNFIIVKLINILIGTVTGFGMMFLGF